jgi:hypothetical protein
MSVEVSSPRVSYTIGPVAVVVPSAGDDRCVNYNSICDDAEKAKKKEKTVHDTIYYTY